MLDHDRKFAEKQVMKIIDPQALRGRAPGLAFAASTLGKVLAKEQRNGSASNKRIADYLLRNPVRAAAASIEDVAGAAGVSSATLSRFARGVGHAGYAEFRHELAATLQAVLQPVEKLKDSFLRAGPEGALAAEGLESTMSNIRATAEALTAGLLADVVTRLVSARAVYVMGFGLSAHLAGYLTLGLQPFLPSVINVVDYGGTEIAAGKLMRLDRSDLLVAISLPRYARDVVQLTAYGRDQGAQVIAITDSPASPLAAHADVLLLAEASHPVLSSSSSAAMLVIEAVMSALMASNPGNLAHAEALTAAISGYLVSGT
jgi:DNA-binding MurR/RpiR family transcriptional regulator